MTSLSRRLTGRDYWSLPGDPGRIAKLAAASAIAAAGLLLGAITGTAHAGSVHITFSSLGYHVSYLDQALVPPPLPSGVELSQPNDVTVSESSDRRAVTIADRGQLMIPGGYVVDEIATGLEFCEFGLGTATCSVPDTERFPFRPITLWLGRGHDVATFVGDTWGDATADEGADRLVGSSAPNLLSGGPGPDVIVAGPGDDSVDNAFGGGDPEASAGADTIRLGPGRDFARAPDDGDVVHARDGEQDRIACDGSDARVIADPVDILDGCPNAEVE